MSPGFEEPDIHGIIKGQRKTIDRLNKQQLILESQVSSLKKKVEETSQQAKKRVKEMRSLVQQKATVSRTQLDAEKLMTKSELESLRHQLDAKDALLTEHKTLVAKLTGENEEFKG